MTVPITGSVKDVTGVEDNDTPWSFASVIRFAEDGSVITEKPRQVRAVSGNLKVNLVPGYAIVTYGKHVWQVDVPETPTTLKALIEAGVAFPPDTDQERLIAAVTPIAESVGTAAAEAAAPAAVGQAAADMNPVPVPGPTPGKIAISFNGTTGEEFNPLPASWDDLVGKPAVIAAGATAGDARAAINAQTAFQIDITQAPYNAVPDGTTDNSAAIQAALNAAAGRPVYIPPGIFGVADSLVMKPGQVFVGSNSSGSAWLSGTGQPLGEISTLKALAGLAGKPMIEGPPASGYVQIRDLHIDANNIASEGIKLTTYSPSIEAQWLLQRLFIHNATGDGVYVGQGRRAVRAWRVVSCYNGGNGIMSFGSDSAWHDSILGANGANGFYAAGTQTRILSSDIFGNGNAGIRVWNGSNEIFISHNSCDRNQLHGIQTGDGCFGIAINNNLFTKNSAGGDGDGVGLAADIYIGASTGVSITSNVFLQGAPGDPKVAYHIVLQNGLTIMKVHESGNFVAELTEELAELLGMEPGSASLFGYINVTDIAKLSLDPTIDYALTHLDGDGLLPNSVGLDKLGEDVEEFITDGFDAGILAERTAARALQNARIIPRIHSVTAPGATPTINLDTYDRSVWTGINANITAVNVAGVAAPWQEYVLVLKDDGSARTLNFGTAFRVMSGVTAPTTTVAGKWIYIRMIANPTDNKFDIYDIKVQP